VLLTVRLVIVTTNPQIISAGSALSVIILQHGCLPALITPGKPIAKLVTVMINLRIISAGNVLPVIILRGGYQPVLTIRGKLIVKLVMVVLLGTMPDNAHNAIQHRLGQVHPSILPGQIVRLVMAEISPQVIMVDNAHNVIPLLAGEAQIIILLVQIVWLAIADTQRNNAQVATIPVIGMMLKGMITMVMTITTTMMMMMTTTIK
jgi:hypothetical protein